MTVDFSGFGNFIKFSKTTALMESIHGMDLSIQKTGWKYVLQWFFKIMIYIYPERKKGASWINKFHHPHLNVLSEINGLIKMKIKIIAL